MFLLPVLALAALPALAMVPPAVVDKIEQKVEAQKVKKEAQAVKQEVKKEVIELKKAAQINNASTTAQMQTKWTNAKAILEQKQSNFKEKLQAKVEVLKEKIQVKKDKLKENLKKIKDEKKQKIVERVDARMEALNQNVLNRLSAVLEHLENVLAKIGTRADKLAVDGKDASAVKLAIDAANKSITASRAAIEAQTGKVYAITINTEDKLKLDVGKTRQQLHNDLDVVRETVVVAHTAVKKAAQELQKISAGAALTSPFPSVSPAIDNVAEPSSNQ